MGHSSATEQPRNTVSLGHERSKARPVLLFPRMRPAKHQACRTRTRAPDVRAGRQKAISRGWGCERGGEVAAPAMGDSDVLGLTGWLHD